MEEQKASLEIGLGQRVSVTESCSHPHGQHAGGEVEGGDCKSSGTKNRRSGSRLNGIFEKSSTMGQARHRRGTRRRSYAQIPAGARWIERNRQLGGVPCATRTIGHDRDSGGTRKPFLSCRGGIH